MEMMTEKVNVWNNILQSVEKRLNKQIFDSWFRPIQFNGCDEQDKVLHLQANQITKDWISSCYLDVISQTMKELNMFNYQLDWEIVKSERDEENFTEDDDGEFFFEKQKVTQNSTKQNGFDFFEKSKPDALVKNNTTNFVDIEPIENSLNQKYKSDSAVNKHRIIGFARCFGDC